MVENLVNTKKQINKQVPQKSTLSSLPWETTVKILVYTLQSFSYAHLYPYTFRAPSGVTMCLLVHNLLFLLGQYSRNTGHCSPTQPPTEGYSARLIVCCPSPAASPDWAKGLVSDPRSVSESQPYPWGAKMSCANHVTLCYGVGQLGSSTTELMV